MHTLGSWFDASFCSRSATEQSLWGLTMEIWEAIE